jgi:hypothetical protein
LCCGGCSSLRPFKDKAGCHFLLSRAETAAVEEAR